MGIYLEAGNYFTLISLIKKKYLFIKYKNDIQIYKKKKKN